MRVFRSAAAAGRFAPGAVVVLGKFDGLHAGHRKLLRAARRRAAALRVPLLAASFYPHPQAYFDPAGYRPLMDRGALLEGLRGEGVDAAVLLPFGRRMACQSPERFALETLAVRLRALEVVVGRDFCFGRGRSGTVETLRALGAEYGFLVRAVPLARRGGRKISSSWIRELLAAGRRGEARALL